MICERMTSEQTTPERMTGRAFLGASALVFVASMAATIVGCASMSAMGETPMAGGWAMSMAWTPLCGQSQIAAGAGFLGMWVVMMMAMMLPSLTPPLWRYRQAIGGLDVRRPGLLTLLAGAGYFFVWAVLGLAAFPLGVGLADLEMRMPAVARAAPMAVGVVVLAAGALQFTAWKLRRLAWRRAAPDDVRRGLGAAWSHGVRLGLQCSRCCAGLTAVQLAMGVMDLRVMAAVTAAITAERLLPGGERVARGVGLALVGLGLVLIVRAGFGTTAA